MRRAHSFFYRNSKIFKNFSRVIGINNFDSNATQVKNELIESYENNKFDRMFGKINFEALQNPIADHAAQMISKKLFSARSLRLIEECKKSAKLVILEDHLKILQDYYQERKIVNDNLGNLYKRMDFRDFIIRLFEKRYKIAYLDGRIVAEREKKYNYDICVTSIKRKESLHEISDLQEKFPNTPIIIKFENDIYIYGMNENTWQLTMLDINKLGKLKFPAENNPIRLTSSEIDLSVYVHIEEKDGHLPRPTLISDYFGDNGRKAIEQVGTNHDHNKYLEYLTLEEMVLSPLLLPQVMSIVVGTGSRNKTDKNHGNIWREEFDKSIDIAIFSSPAAAELRDGITAHHDLLFITKPETNYTPEQEKRLDSIRNNKPLLKAARKIYGPTFAFENSEDNDVLLESYNGKRYYLNISAYKNRTKNILRQILLSSDIEMQSAGLGKTFQLKGLGLGAFSFSNPKSIIAMKCLFLESLIEVLQDCNLRHINQINLLSREKYEGIHEIFIVNKIKLTQIRMDPTENNIEDKKNQTGGTIFCGDSASQVGNEGNIGAGRDSSDDPATLYSLFDPYILNPAKNEYLNKDKSIFVVDKHLEMLIFDEYTKEEKNLPRCRL